MTNARQMRLAEARPKLAMKRLWSYLGGWISLWESPPLVLRHGQIVRARPSPLLEWRSRTASREAHPRCQPRRGHAAARRQAVASAASYQDASIHSTGAAVSERRCLSIHPERGCSEARGGPGTHCSVCGLPDEQRPSGFGGEGRPETRSRLDAMGQSSPEGTAALRFATPCEVCGASFIHKPGCSAASPPEVKITEGVRDYVLGVMSGERPISDVPPGSVYHHHSSFTISAEEARQWTEPGIVTDALIDHVLGQEPGTHEREQAWAQRSAFGQPDRGEEA